MYRETPMFGNVTALVGLHVTGKYLGSSHRGCRSGAGLYIQFRVSGEGFRGSGVGSKVGGSAFGGWGQ